MNRSYTLAASIVLLSRTLVAQPTIDLANNRPVNGQEFVLNTSTTWIWEGPTGADVDFNFWDLVRTGNRNYRAYDASISSAAAANVPTANMLSTDGGLDTLYWNYTADGLYLAGSRSPLEGALPVNLSDPLLELKYPCTFGTTWTDNVAATYTSQAGEATRTGTVTGIADAWGQFDISEASLPSVLRVKVSKDITDVSAIATLRRVTDTWYFYSENYPWPVLKLVNEAISINGGTSTATRSAQWMFGPGGVSVGEIDPDSFTFTPYPNPANGRVDLNIGTSDVRTIEVLTATGQLVWQERASNGSSLTGILDVSGFASGVYQVRLTQADGRQGTQRLVVQ
ncbi:MAG: T9SS type A sorting domain-containing protein [Flavobacteriales bacterium]|nr:T9SS type A sorting domain-containing protein [Flavobacteriales bacterium]